LAVAVLVPLLLVGGFLGGRAMLLRSSWFRVTRVEVQADPGLDPAVIRAAAGVRLGQPLLSVDPDAVRRAVGSLAPVAGVTASRDWPHTVRLAVTERTPVALTASATGPWLVDASGLAYQPAPHSAPTLPMLIADRVAQNDPATHAALAVLTSLTPSILQKLQVMDAQGPNAVVLRLIGGKQVLWGSPDDSGRKAQVLEALLSQPGSYYDVSAPDLPTVRR
jgi:cell division protein FtsQ